MTNGTCKRLTLQCLAITAVSAAALAVHAAEPAARRDGVMTFPNVQVTAASAAASKADGAQPAPASPGFRAFVDPATRRLVEPTAPEAAALEAAQASSQRRRLTPAQSSTPSPLFYPAQGGVAMQLDESHMSHSVVQRDKDGNLVTLCLPDAHAAQQALTVPIERGANPVAKGELK